MKEEYPLAIAIHCISFDSEEKRRRFLKDWNDDEALIKKRDEWFENNFKITIEMFRNAKVGTGFLKKEALKVCPIPEPKCGDDVDVFEFYLDEHCIYFADDDEVDVVLNAMKVANIEMDEFFTEEKVYPFCREIDEKCPELFDAIDEPTEDCYPLLYFQSMSFV